MSRNKIGSQRQLSIGNTCVMGTAIRVEEVQTPEMKGELVTYAIENYGETQDYWEADGMGQEASRNRNSRSMMPPEYVFKTGKDFDWTLYGEDVQPQKRIANSFVGHFHDFQKQGRGLFIHSKVKGSGKTFLACCIANEVVKRNDISVKFITAPEYIELLKEKGEQEKDIVKQLKNCSLLVFDDIGAEPEKPEWIAQSVFRLVDWRDKNFLPTIYTSNCSMDELKGDERTVDRIVSHSVLLQMPEVGIRRKKAMQANGKFLTEVFGGGQYEEVFN